MSTKLLSIIGTLTNLLLGIVKLGVGYTVGSMALIADGMHSGMDVISSFVTFLGIRAAEKPVDEKHPYGYYRAESIAGFFVTLLLTLSGIWIIYEAISSILNPGDSTLGIIAIIVAVFSVVINEILSKMEFHFGQKYQSLALIADAEHNRADALSSIGVLVGLVLANYYALADELLALAIGFYILYESFELGKETTDALLDVSDEKIENKIKKIIKAHNIKIAELKTRKISAYNFAELLIKLPPKLKLEEVDEIISSLEERLLSNIPKLKHIVISVESYEVERDTLRPSFGKKVCELEGFEEIGPKKQGKRTIIPLQEKEISSTFGSKEYAIFDNGKFIKKIENPYYSKESPHGPRFTKAVRADKVISLNIGENAKNNLDHFGVEIELLSKKEGFEELKNKIEKNE